VNAYRKSLHMPFAAPVGFPVITNAAANDPAAKTDAATGAALPRGVVAVAAAAVPSAEGMPHLAEEPV
jgi:hypothetical protein